MSLTHTIVTKYAAVYVDSPDRRVHLVLSSGRHSNGYINLDPATVDTQVMWYLAGEMVQSFLGQLLPRLIGKPLQLTESGRLVVVTPPWGSIRLADYFALQLQMLTGKRVWMSIIEKDASGNFFIDRDGHKEALYGSRVIVIEDVSTTGKNTLKTLELVKGCGGTPLAVGSVWNRGGVTATDLSVDESEVTIFTLIDEQIIDWEANKCPLCESNAPIATDLGHGAKYQTENPDYSGGFTTLLD